MNNYDNTNKGAVWLKTSKNGLKYMSGILDVNGVDHDIAMFKNDKKGNENAPDYRLVVTNKQEQESGQAVAENKESNPYQDFADEQQEIELSDLDLPF